MGAGAGAGAGAAVGATTASGAGVTIAAATAGGVVAAGGGALLQPASVMATLVPTASNALQTSSFELPMTSTLLTNATPRNLPQLRRSAILIDLIVAGGRQVAGLPGLTMLRLIDSGVP